MGFLSINRNLLSKFIPKSFSSSDLCFFRRIFSPAPTVVGDFLISHNHDGVTNYSLLSAKNKYHHHHRICSPFSGRPDKYDLVGSCKEWTLFWSFAETNTLQVEEEGFGDILVVDKDGNRFHQYQRCLSLWNPTTNHIKTLSPPSLPRHHRFFSINIDSFGFGFDPKSQDYKLICFLQHDCLSYTFDCDCYVNVELSSLKTEADTFSEFSIELYSLKTDSWKLITAPPDIATPYFHLHSVHINGVHYWARDSILSFDFAEETFSRFSLPDVPHLRRMDDNFCLAEFHGSLAVIVPYWDPTEVLTEVEKQEQPFSIEIWVWNGETWNVGPMVAVGDFPVRDKIPRLLGLFQNEYLFLQGCDEAELMLFNCKTGKLENLGIQHGARDSTTPVRRPGIFPYSVSI